MELSRTESQQTCQEQVQTRTPIQIDPQQIHEQQKQLTCMVQDLKQFVINIASSTQTILGLVQDLKQEHTSFQLEQNLLKQQQNMMRQELKRLIQDQQKTKLCQEKLANNFYTYRSAPFSMTSCNNPSTSTTYTISSPVGKLDEMNIPIGSATVSLSGPSGDQDFPTLNIKITDVDFYLLGSSTSKVASTTPVQDNIQHNRQTTEIQKLSGSQKQSSHTSTSQSPSNKAMSSVEDELKEGMIAHSYSNDDPSQKSVPDASTFQQSDFVVKTFNNAADIHRDSIVNDVVNSIIYDQNQMGVKQQTLTAEEKEERIKKMSLYIKTIREHRIKAQESQAGVNCDMKQQIVPSNSSNEESDKLEIIKKSINTDANLIQNLSTNNQLLKIQGHLKDAVVLSSTTLSEIQKKQIKKLSLAFKLAQNHKRKVQKSQTDVNCDMEQNVPNDSLKEESDNLKLIQGAIKTYINSIESPSRSNQLSDEQRNLKFQQEQEVKKPKEELDTQQEKALEDSLKDESNKSVSNDSSIDLTDYEFL